MFKDLTFNFIPIMPLWAIAGVGIVGLALLIWGSIHLRQKLVPAKWVAIHFVLRVIALAVFLVCLMQPVVGFTKNVALKPDLLVLMDTSESMGTKDQAADKSRLDYVRDGLNSGFLSKMQSRFNVTLFSFDKSARPAAQEELANLSATGTTTRFAESIRGAWDYYQQDVSSRDITSAPPVRAVMVSDGDDLSNEDSVKVAQDLGLPIYTLGPAQPKSENAPANIVVSSVQSPRRVLLGSESRILATIRQKNMDNKPLELVLTENGKEIRKESVTFPTGVNERQVRFHHRPGEPGLKVYEFFVREKEAPVNAADKPKPAYRLSINVMDEKHEVLLIQDTWRWDFRYIRRVLENDPSFAFTGFLRRGGGAYVQAAEPDRRVRVGGFPESLGELEGFDTIILSSVDYDNMSKRMANAIFRLVTEDGKSLIVVADSNIGSVQSKPQIYLLLPVDLDKIKAGQAIDGPIAVHVTPEGLSSPFFFTPQGSGDKGNVWKNLPPLGDIFQVIKKRPGATILLEAHDDKSELKNQYGWPIVMAEQTVGRGRVLYINTDTLWRWQSMARIGPNSGLTPYELFWQQTMRAMTPARSSTGGVYIELQTNRSKYEAGQKVQVRAKIENTRPLDRPVIEANVLMPDGQSLPLGFSAHPTEKGVYLAEFEPTKEGQYRLNAQVVSAGKTLADTATAIDVDAPRGERNSIDVNLPNLARIADGTGGKVIDLNNSDTWPIVENAAEVRADRHFSWRLWDNYSLLVLLCIVFGIDWTIRLLRGYV
jgi:hypothetical protein